MKQFSKRYLTNQVRDDLKRKMVFVAGPRQVGKTTLAKGLLGRNDLYLNWDDIEDRERILKRELPDKGLLVLDEVHKYRSWRNYLKGLFDKRGDSLDILVTGSAKLDYYRFGGDSLQGRYHFLRLHPLSAAELKISKTADLETLLKLGGFPEPFFGGQVMNAKRWSREYRHRLVVEELTSLEKLADIGKLQLLLLRLPDLVGSPLSINALREDLQISHVTCAKWLDVFERLYAIFRVSPFGAPKIRAVKKEQKHYHFDWNVIEDEATRFENLVASHLLKWVHFQQDTAGRELDLLYFRDTDGREVDFVITEDRKPISFIECKLADADISKGLRYLCARFSKVEALQIHLRGKKSFTSDDGIRVMPALEFLKTLI